MRIDVEKVSPPQRISWKILRTRSTGPENAQHQSLKSWKLITKLIKTSAALVKNASKNLAHREEWESEIWKRITCTAREKFPFYVLRTMPNAKCGTTFSARAERCSGDMNWFPLIVESNWVIQTKLKDLEVKFVSDSWQTLVDDDEFRTSLERFRNDERFPAWRALVSWRPQTRIASSFVD